MARCSFSRIERRIMPKGELTIRQITEQAEQEDGQHEVVHASGSLRSMKPKKVPRGTPWMPSSPPVKSACTQKKKNICDSASVIIAK